MRLRRRNVLKRLGSAGRVFAGHFRVTRDFLLALRLTWLHVAGR